MRKRMFIVSAMMLLFLVALFVASVKADDAGVTWLEKVASIIASDSSVTAEEFERLDGVTSGIQTQLDVKVTSAEAVAAVTNEYSDLDTDSTDDVTQDSTNLLTEGYFDVDGNALNFISEGGTVTNQIVADISS